MQVVAQYTMLGFTHILPKGLDHILFVLGLFLLSIRWKPLLVQVTAFTLAHTITLGLSIYGIVSLAPAIVEPLIAASIAYVAIENLVTAELKPWRAFVVFGFGLLHGLGFAGVLHEIGLPRSEFLTALLSFNVGVELGQLAVIVSAWLLVGLWWKTRSWYRARLVQPLSALIAAVGVYWTIERIIGWAGSAGTLLGRVRGCLVVAVVTARFRHPPLTAAPQEAAQAPLLARAVHAFAHGDGAAFQLLLVEVDDGLVGGLFWHQVHMAVAERQAGVGVAHDDGVDGGAVAGEQPAQVVRRDGRGEIPHEDIH
jgi:hypothetical protein